MSLLSLFLLAAGLSMDAFAVSVCKGLALKKIEWKSAALVGLWFGAFQALMPLLGYLAGAQFRDIIAAYDHWIAFGLLLLIGGNMIREALFDREEALPDASLSAKAMLPLAIATSIDALAAGITFAFLSVQVWSAVLLIGLVTFLFSATGVRIGGVFGGRFEKKAEVLGGAILILLGTKILLEHLEIL